ncbi:MAG: NAD-dependent epimerase/dehydratase family protein, partial [Bacteroidota bacterium]
MKKILIVGALGQIGSELTMELRKLYGGENVIASDKKDSPSEKLRNSGPFEIIDIIERDSIIQLIKKYNINIIIDLAAILSATGEKNPMLAWNVNINGLINVLEIAREYNMQQVLIPSSIAV